MRGRGFSGGCIRGSQSAPRRGSPRSPSEWKKPLAIIRCLANAAVTLAVHISKGSGLPSAALIGLLAGAWSAAMQYYNHEYLSWLTGKHWLRVHDTEQASVRRLFLKKSASTAVYALMMTTAFSVTHLNHDPLISLGSAWRMGIMVAESLFTQTCWQALNQQWTADAIVRDPEQAWYHKRLSGIGSLVQSIINVTSNILNLGGSGIGTCISGVVGTTGVATYYWRVFAITYRKLEHRARAGAAAPTRSAGGRCPQEVDRTQFSPTLPS